MIHRIVTFIREVQAELRKVSWSSRQVLIGSTWVVLISAAFLGLVVGFFDLVCSSLVQLMVR